MVEKSSALWMCGSAMFTMVMSRTTINWHEAMTRSAIPLPPSFLSEAAVCEAGVGCGVVMAHRVPLTRVRYDDSVYSSTVNPGRRRHHSIKTVRRPSPR